MTRTRLHLVFNARSGAFVRGLTIDALRKAIVDAGWTVSGETDITSGSVDTADMADADAVAIAGGDGTVMAVLNACADADTPPVLVLPCGTANLLARHIHSTIALDEVLAGARDAAVKPLELGEANGKTFAVAAAIGISPAFARLREEMRDNRGWRRIRRFPAYLAAGFRSFFRGQFYANLHDDLAPRRTTALYVSCPDTLVTDGRFTVQGGRMRNIADLAGGVALAAVPGFPEAGPNWITEAKRLTVTSRGHVPVLLDGEPERMDSPVELEFGTRCVDVIAV